MDNFCPFLDSELIIKKKYPHLSNSIVVIVSVVASVVVLSSVIFLGANGNIVKEGKPTGPTFFVKVVIEGKPTDSDSFGYCDGRESFLLSIGNMLKAGNPTDSDSDGEDFFLLSIGNMLKEGNPTDSDSDDNSLVNNLCVDDSGEGIGKSVKAGKPTDILSTL